jgi:hypothetical protein
MLHHPFVKHTLVVLAILLTAQRALAQCSNRSISASLTATSTCAANSVENAIRPLAPGRKNYLFAGSYDGARRAAAICSFVAMCRKEEVNPFEWLRHVFGHIGDTKMNRLETLYPRHFQVPGKMELVGRKRSNECPEEAGIDARAYRAVISSVYPLPRWKNLYPL